MPALIIILSVTVFLFVAWILLISAKREPRDKDGTYGDRFAHRGLHDIGKGIPENSMPAFRAAVSHGFGAELDVHLTADGRLVVIHDSDMTRLAGRDGDIRKMDSDEIGKLRLLGTEERPPFFEEVLPLFENTVPLLIEIKTCGEKTGELTSKVVEMLDAHPGVRYFIQSFDPRALIWLRKNRPEIKRGQLSADMVKVRKKEKLPLPAAIILKNLLTNFLTRPDFIAYEVHSRYVFSLRLCRKIWGVKEFNWLVTDQETADACDKDGRTVIFEGFVPVKNIRKD